jgi:two-component system, OmpR family, sensor histidine kinase BaeS
MPSLRLRLIGLFLLVSLAVATVMFLAVQRFSAEPVMHLAMESGLSPEDAQAMFDVSVSRVLIVGAAAGLLVGLVAAWWLLRRILRPLERLTLATRAISAGDLAARVPPAPDPELQRLADAFNQMAATLERVEQLRRSLVEDVAHELRTPLTSLQGYTEALADGVVDPTPEMLRTVHEEIVRLSHLVTGLDQLARREQASVEAGLPAVPDHQRVEIDLSEVLRRAAQIHTPELASRSITVTVAESGPLPRVVAEPDAIGQVVANLMQNAARYTDKGGEIVLRLRAEGPWVRCTVENTGTTIPAEELPFIWERLYRVDHSRTRASGGAGIGLAIVRQLVEAHGGQVGASSEDGRTIIWFRLPAPEA